MNMSIEQWPVKLRPMAEADLEKIVAWNRDTEVMYWYDGSQSRQVEEIQNHYLTAMREANCWIIESQDVAIGECRLCRGCPPVPEMVEQFAGLNVAFIELMIGEKGYWGQGIGTKVICLLTEYAINNGIDVVTAFDINDYNSRSIRAFESVGYQRFMQSPAGIVHMVLLKDDFTKKGIS